MIFCVACGYWFRDAGYPNHLSGAGEDHAKLKKLEAKESLSRLFAEEEKEIQRRADTLDCGE